MPPKQKFSRQEVVAAALDIIRRQGLSGLTARALAQELGCSAKPVFGLFQNMKEVQREAIASANTLYQACLQEEMESGRHPPYKASGMGYIRFAREEKELFKLMFMRDRTQEDIQENRQEILPLLRLIQQNLGIDEDQAYLFHVEMWVFVHGMATMVATSYLDWDMDFVGQVLTDAYLGIGQRFLEKGAANGRD